MVDLSKMKIRIADFGSGILLLSSSLNNDSKLRGSVWSTSRASKCSRAGSSFESRMGYEGRPLEFGRYGKVSLAACTDLQVLDLLFRQETFTRGAEKKAILTEMIESFGNMPETMYAKYLALLEVGESKYIFGPANMSSCHSLVASNTNRVARLITIEWQRNRIICRLSNLNAGARSQQSYGPF